MATVKTITYKTKTGKTVSRKVQVLPDGRYKFLKSGSKAGGSSKTKSKGGGSVAKKKTRSSKARSGPGRRKYRVISVVDGLHAAATVNSMMDDHLADAAEEAVKGVFTDDSRYSLDDAIDDVVDGAVYMVKNPKDSVIKGVKTAAIIGGVRWFASLIPFIPKTVGAGRFKIQVR